MGWPGPMTHRQFLAWQEWLLEDMNRPSRSDHYLMLIAHEARYSNRTYQSFETKQYQIPFCRPEDPSSSPGGSAGAGGRQPGESPYANDLGDDDGWEQYAQESDPRLRPPPLATAEMILESEKADRRWQLERAARASARQP